MWALNFCKPPGMTSYDAVAFVKKRFAVKRVGHAGTLDPAAAGVLPIFLGTGTRLVEYMADAGKSYRAEVIFGMETDTCDYTGRVIGKSEKMPTISEIEAVLNKFCGKIEQVPPIYSAIKVSGRKMYELARNNVDVECKARLVQINSITVLSYHKNILRIDVDCEKGTYIRSLCRDLGVELNTVATMGMLLRTAVGNFDLADSYAPEEVLTMGEDCLTHADKVIDNLAVCELDEPQEQRILCGQRLRVNADSFLAGNGIMRAYNSKGDFLGIVRHENGVLHPHKMMR